MRPEARVLKDEMGSNNTSVHELYAYSARGERACCSVARNRTKNTTTLLWSMSLWGMGPSMVVEGGANGAVFSRATSGRCSFGRLRRGTWW